MLFHFRNVVVQKYIAVYSFKVRKNVNQFLNYKVVKKKTRNKNEEYKTLLVFPEKKQLLLTMK